ncbi:MAG: hypothetical protein ACRDHL_10615 [Candidatus Promineifilaceae bacterium]
MNRLVMGVAIAWLLSGCQQDGAATAMAAVLTVPPSSDLFGTPAVTIPPPPTLDPAEVARGHTCTMTTPCWLRRSSSVGHG